MLWSTDPASLRRQRWSLKAPLNNISHSDELLVPSHCWLLYVLDRWCLGPAAICCWLLLVPASTLLLSCVFYVLRVTSAENVLIGLNYFGFICGMCWNISPEARIKSVLWSDPSRQRCWSQFYLRIDRQIEKVNGNRFKYITTHEHPTQLLWAL